MATARWIFAHVWFICACRSPHIVSSRAFSRLSFGRPPSSCVCIGDVASASPEKYFATGAPLGRRSTKLICGMCYSSLVNMLWTGVKGLCIWNGQRHIQCKGGTPLSEQFWTHIVDPFPRCWCASLVQMLVAACKQLRHNRFGNIFGI